MKIVVLNGGISTERDVSLVSGAQIYKALKGKNHDVILLDVFMGYEEEIPAEGISALFTADIDWAAKVEKVSSVAPDLTSVKAARRDKSNAFFGEHVIEICREADIVFMALHGDAGENGKIQATFDLFDIKYTGTDYLSSALAMDKTVTKAMFLNAGVSTPGSYVISADAKADCGSCGTSQSVFEQSRFGYPCVVKAANGGSSIGVYIANNDDEYREAVSTGLKLDTKVLVEQFVKGREFTDCVIEGKALPVVEIIPKQGFYDYKNKYQAGSTVEVCPADISEDVAARIQALALSAYNALGIKTYARMDVLMNENGELFCLEANTLPGMTPTSLIPQEAAAVGVGFAELCEWIIRISLKKYE